MKTITTKFHLIKTGPLNSIRSATYFLTTQLSKYWEETRQGKHTLPIFDMTDIEPRRQSMAALTTLLSVAENLSRYIGSPVDALTNYNQSIFSFWHDIGFTELTKIHETISFIPPDIIGGYCRGQTNPNTKILRYSSDDCEPIPTAGTEEFKKWKNRYRDAFADILSSLVGSLFTERENQSKEKFAIYDISITAAELVLNSIMHSNSPCYIGLQRAKQSVSVAVCDSGDGFIRSLSRHPRLEHHLNRGVYSNISSILFGCLMSRVELGLYDTIGTIVNGEYFQDGSVTISSYNSEILWRSTNFQKAKDLLSPNFYVSPADINVENILGKCVEGSPSSTELHNGFWTNHKTGLKGTRISFEIKLKDTH